ncbi:MAG: hypothetical protein LQ344_005303 [Seirophora lacunosa]|nr:MAG: hypothetical protein LQ344_005303 [Seirophora lacunosa]
MAKTKAYGKQSSNNIVLQLERLNIKSPKKDFKREERQPQAIVDEKAEGAPERPKVKRNKKHRKSLIFDRCDDIKTVNVDGKTKRHLDPLTCLSEVSTAVLDFADWFRVWTSHCNFIKIAQGTYGAVFRIESKAEPGTFTIGKLMPLQAPSGFGSKTKDFTAPVAGHNEVLLLSRLDELPGFVQFRKAETLIGVLPAALQTASAEFDAAHEDDITTWWTRACSNSAQPWLFLEMTDAGTDLEAVIANQVAFRPGAPTSQALTVTEIRDVFWQVASALALAEQRFEFEHRDLHLGNICLTFPKEIVSDSGYALWTNKASILVTIIDYTLSRACVSSSVLAPTYNDLEKDPALFQGSGLPQYDVYRDMRSESDGDWASYRPRTNVLWLYHLLVTLLEKADTYRGPGQIQLARDLTELKQWMSENSGKSTLGNAQDVVRYCEANGRKDH